MIALFSAMHIKFTVIRCTQQQQKQLQPMLEEFKNIDIEKKWVHAHIIVHLLEMCKTNDSIGRNFCIVWMNNWEKLRRRREKTLHMRYCIENNQPTTKHHIDLFNSHHSAELIFCVYLSSSFFTSILCSSFRSNYYYCLTLNRSRK